MSSQEAMEDWTWLESELVAVLDRFETPDEITDFVTGKIASIVASNTTDVAEINETAAYKSAKNKIQRLFNICTDTDKLVTYYSSTLWSGRHEWSTCIFIFFYCREQQKPKYDQSRKKMLKTWKKSTAHSFLKLRIFIKRYNENDFKR